MIYRARVMSIGDALAYAALLDAVPLQTDSAGGWTVGEESAGVRIKGLKWNRQLAARDAPDIHVVRLALTSVPVTEHLGNFSLHEPRFSRYQGGDRYGTHVDNSVAGGLRVDVSMSLMLRKADNGGHMLIYVGTELVRLDLDPGEVVMFASHLRHEVETVTAGVRIVAVAGATCAIKDPVQREVVRRLARVVPHTAAEATDDLAFALVNADRLWTT